MRKDRARNLAAELSKLARRERILNDKLKRGDTQLMRVAQELSVARGKHKELKAELEVKEGELEALPMIVGRQINKVIDPFYANPTQTYNTLVHHSKLEIIRDQAKPALAAHKEARKMDHGVWFANQRLANEKVQVEGLLTRLAGASERLKKARSSNLQADLMEAISAFHKNKCELNVVDEQHSGTVDWWRYRDLKFCRDCDQWYSNDEAVVNMKKIENMRARLGQVALQNSSIDSFHSFDDSPSKLSVSGSPQQTQRHSMLPAADEDSAMNEAVFQSNVPPDEDPNRQGFGLYKGHAGYLMGVIKLPKFAVWTIQFLVTKRCPERLNDRGLSAQGDPADWLTVKLGTSLKNLNEVKVVRNVANEETGEIKQEISYTLRCQDLAYRFEFCSSSDDETEHFVVERGEYFQKQFEPLEITDVETGRVLSDYVKRVRIEEKQGKLRSANLITELISAEESVEKFWDSGALFGVFQKSSGVSNNRGSNMGANLTVGKRSRESGGASGYAIRYPKDVFIRLVKEELMKIKAETEAEEREKSGLDAGEMNDLEQVQKGNAKKRMNLSKKQKHELVLSESAAAYEKRKRDKYEAEIAEAKRIEKANIEIFDVGSQQWEQLVVLRCVIKWIENGTKPKIEHECKRLSGDMEPVGEPFMMDLKTVRFYVSEEKGTDSTAQESHKENERVRLKAEKAERDRLKRAEREARKKREAQEKENEQFEDAKAAAIERARETAEEEAKKKVKDAAVKKEIQLTVKSVYHELRAGISGDAQKISMGGAKKEAERRWKEEFVKKAIVECDEIWKAASEQRTKEAHEEEIRVAGERAQKEEADKKLVEEKNKHILAAVSERTRNLKATIKIKNFEKAVHKAPMCEHMRTRNWGDCYGKGLRCLDCGKELTRTDEEENQQKGIGSGEDPALVADIVLHRVNESSFRFRDGDHLRSIERERARLEKERREMDLARNVFYDYEDVKAIYEFDRRHKIYFKEQRIVRQGVQWSERELEELKEQKIKEIEQIDPLHQMQARKDLDMFYASFNPPTFRANAIKSKAAFHDLLHAIARINSFRQRIRELKDYRVEIVSERGQMANQLSYLHARVFKLEVELRNVGNDLQDAAGRVKVIEQASNEYKKVYEILKIAEHDKKLTDLARVGVEGSAEEAEDVVRDLGEQVRSILRHRMKEERKTRALSERAKRARKRSNELQSVLKETQDKIDLMHYRVRGQLVPTKFGPLKVLFFREADEMLCVNFPFGVDKSKKDKEKDKGKDKDKDKDKDKSGGKDKSNNAKGQADRGENSKPVPGASLAARLYVPIHECMNIDRGRQEANIVAMDREEAFSKAYYKAEKKLITEEKYRMGAEDKFMKEMDEYRRSITREETLVYNSVMMAVNDARIFMRKKVGAVELKKRIDAALAKEERERKMKELTWTGVGKRPKPMHDWERLRFRMKVRRPLRKAFIVEMAKQAEAETLSMLAAERAKVAEAQTFEFVMNEFVHEFMAELCEETIVAGMSAKDRAEENTGIVFPEPKHMQYDIYCVLRRWWMVKKTELRKRLETWGVRSAQDAERLEQAKRAAAELEMDIVRREREAKEKQRQAAMIQLLAKEEAFSRRFYRAELKQTLGERRSMAEEEGRMKLFLKEEEIERKAASSKYNVFTGSDDSGGPSEKENRRAQLKKSAAERNRVKKEIELMKYEDELAGALRAADKKREQLELLKAEMDLWGGGDLEEEEDDVDINSDVSSEESDYSEEDEEEREKRKEEDADWKASVKGGEMTADELDEGRLRRKKERQARRRKKAKRRAEARQEAAERRAAEEWERSRQEALVKHASREMEWMEEEEEAKEVEKELFTHEANVRKLKLYGQSKGKEELRMRAIAKKKRDHSDNCVEANMKAIEWRERCQMVVEKRLKIKERLQKECSFMDTKAVTRFHQRWKTVNLHARLHQLYFRTLAIIIANKAEIVAGERRMMRLMELLLVNEGETASKIKQMEARWKKHQRNELLRLHRSALGQKIFKKSRTKVLKSVYEGWVRFWLWHKGHKQAFELKYKMIKQELDLRRLYPETRDELERKEMGTVKYDGADEVPKVRKTILQAHKEKVIECRYCQEFYLETQNNDMACAYHPGEYKVCCPKSCPGHTDSKMVTTKCMSHRFKRWTCCDVREEVSVLFFLPKSISRTSCSNLTPPPPPLFTLYFLSTCLLRVTLEETAAPLGFTCRRAEGMLITRREFVRSMRRMRRR